MTLVKGIIFFSKAKSHSTFIIAVAFCLCAELAITTIATAQPIDKSTIYSPKTLQQERIKQQAGLWKYGILPVLKLTPDSTNEHLFQGALGAISQFMLKNDTTRQILDSLFANYNAINTETKRSMMEVVYGLYKGAYLKETKAHWPNEPSDKVATMMVVHLYRANKNLVDSAAFNRRIIVDTTAQNRLWKNTDLVQTAILTYFPEFRKGAKPKLTDFFEHQKELGTKIIYSFQRENRDFPGLAIVQNADGSFIKDAKGKLKTFVQLARSASNLPYFITDGSTPQGIFRIDSTDISKNQFIGPTPNIQLRMPNEIPGDSFFIHLNQPIIGNSIYLEEYDKLLPSRWQTDDMRQSFYAGKVGRSEIIAHGSTIDPSFYKGKPFYPNTPTMGCLCAKETWDPKTGKLLQSDQLDLVNAFLSTPGADGYFFVINIDDQQKAVTQQELQLLVDGFEKKKRGVAKK
ncbi:MAG: hypothetical protein V4722_12085 [Bacteroidota bacterium]